MRTRSSRAARVRALAAAAALAAIGAAGAGAQPRDAVFIEDLTSPEVRALVQSGTTTVIVPTGGTEQNGAHMALGKHNARARALSERIARALGRTLVAPVVAYVPEGGLAPPTGHMRFPGTLGVPEPVFEKVLEAAARSLKLHGFRDVVFLGDHGGSQAGQQAVTARLNREWAATSARAHAVVEYYRAAETEYPRLLAARGYGDAELGRHAGLADTALMLALDPGLVRMDRLRAGTGARDGVDGDPTRASAELGRLGVDVIVARTVAAIRAALAHR